MFKQLKLWTLTQLSKKAAMISQYHSPAWRWMWGGNSLFCPTVCAKTKRSCFTLTAVGVIKCLCDLEEFGVISVASKIIHTFNWSIEIFLKKFLYNRKRVVKLYQHLDVIQHRQGHSKLLPTSFPPVSKAMNCFQLGWFVGFFQQHQVVEASDLKFWSVFSPGE